MKQLKIIGFENGIGTAAASDIGLLSSELGAAQCNNAEIKNLRQ